MTMPVLKPCPHCGHKAALMKLPNTRPFVECQGRPAFATDGFACGARSGYYSTDAEAIAAWNTRTPSSATPEVSELVESLLRLHEKMAQAKRRGRPYPIKLVCGDDDPGLILSTIVALERSKP